MSVEDGEPDYEWRIDSQGKIRVGFGVKRREPEEGREKKEGGKKE